jgi:molecular chaperone DnaJ
MRFSLTCPKCGGSGRLRNTCPTCHGDGRISAKETVEVRIPAGAPSGDLYITVRVEPHPFFRRSGDDRSRV